MCAPAWVSMSHMQLCFVLSLGLWFSAWNSSSDFVLTTDTSWAGDQTCMTCTNMKLCLQMSDHLPAMCLCPVSRLSQRRVCVMSSKKRNHKLLQRKETLEVLCGLVSFFSVSPSGISGTIAQTMGPEPPTQGNYILRQYSFLFQRVMVIWESLLKLFPKDV